MDYSDLRPHLYLALYRYLIKISSVADAISNRLAVLNSGIMYFCLDTKIYASLSTGLLIGAPLNEKLDVYGGEIYCGVPYVMGLWNRVAFTYVPFIGIGNKV